MTKSDIDADTQTIDERWMQRALKLAQKAYEFGEVPVGAILIRGEAALGEGWNQPITACDASAHAEVVAIRQAGLAERNYRLPGSTLYVTVEPCTMCVGAIVHARVERVVYGTREPKAGAVESTNRLFEFPAFNHHVEFQGGVLAEACSELISSFFALRRQNQKKLKHQARLGQDEVR